MGFTPGDFNGDGRSDYVDYKIFTTQVDPYSGEYQGPSSSSGGGGSGILALGFLGFLVMSFFAAMGDDVIIFRQFLYSGALLFLFPWKKFNRALYPFRKPYGTIVAVLSFLTPASIAALVYYLEKSFFTIGIYYKYEVELEAFLIYYWPLIAYLILVFVASKDVPGLTVGCLLIALSPVLNQAVEAVRFMIDKNYFIYQYLYLCLPCLSLLFWMFAIVKPGSKILPLLTLGSSVAYVLLVNVRRRGFALVPELVMICVMAIMILIKQTKVPSQKKEKAVKQLSEEKTTEQTKTIVKKRKPKKGVIIGFFLVAIAAAAVVVCMPRISAYRENAAAYAKAEELLEQKKYDEAAKAFKALGSFKDSAARENEANEAKKADKEAKNADDYLKAEQLLKDKKYDQAAKLFKALGDYRDSKALMNEAVDAQNAIDYSEAERLYNNKDYDKAAAAFKALGSYKDSATRAAEILKSKDFKKIGNIVTFESYEQDNNLSNGKEPIEWIVLDQKDGKALLISRYVLDCKKYNELWKAVTWETCTLRGWLNEEFFNKAFSDKEKSRIILTTVDNSKEQGNKEWYTDGGNNTEDRIFLLSYSEVKRYWPDEKSRWCYGTKYSYAQGGYNTVSCWWLRSPGSTQQVAVLVGPSGRFWLDKSVSWEEATIRPAFWIELS